MLAVGRARMCQVVYFRKTTDSIMAPGLEPQIIKLDAGREFSAAMWLDGDAMGVGVQKN